MDPMATANGATRNPEKSSRSAHVVRRLRKARELIETDFDQPLCLSDLAAAAFMSDAHFVRQFRREFGLTPYRCLTDRRLQAAKDMLRTSRMPVTDIVGAAGFGNRSAFSRLFKNRFGVSPQEYRMRNRRFRVAPAMVPSYRPDVRAW